MSDTPDGITRRFFVQTLGLGAAASALESHAYARARSRPELEGDDDTIIGPDPAPVTLRINGKAHRVDIEPASTLLDVLRRQVGLTGSKEICDRGSCGGCSVLIDGVLTASCMTLAHDAAGHEITTVEGLAEGDRLDPVQEAFIRHDALQCGYCTPGLVIAARALLNENPRPTLDEIKHGLAGNICRCGTYTNIFNAVLEASGQAPLQDKGSRHG
ncbi:MAG: (2Fe-2S)-binding protein [Phycisphaerales bacterium]|nr:(2Fe-2S)-binding protein [Phycisphaerales bacterium]